MYVSVNEIFCQILITSEVCTWLLSDFKWNVRCLEVSGYRRIWFDFA